jgi:hypothetical protein
MTSRMVSAEGELSVMVSFIKRQRDLASAL